MTFSSAGFDDIIYYEIYARSNSTQTPLVLVKIDYNTTCEFQCQFTLASPDYSSFYFALKARNSFGLSNFSKELLVVAGNSPYAVKQVEINYFGTDISISWNNSFKSNGF